MCDIYVYITSIINGHTHNPLHVHIGSSGLPIQGYSVSKVGHGFLLAGAFQTSLKIPMKWSEPLPHTPYSLVMNHEGVYLARGRSPQLWWCLKGVVWPCPQLQTLPNTQA